MTETLNTAFVTLAVGMLTVFFILILIVIVGNLIIRLMNRYAPVAEEKVKKNNSINASKNVYAAIVAAVDVLTEGKGSVSNIKNI